VVDALGGRDAQRAIRQFSSAFRHQGRAVLVDAAILVAAALGLVLFVWITSVHFPKSVVSLIFGHPYAGQASFLAHKLRNAIIFEHIFGLSILLKEHKRAEKNFGINSLV